jgi:hypothetical protein
VQQPEEERRADQGGDHADWHANSAGNGVGEEQQERPADRGERQYGARVGANSKAGQVRHHETNKPNKTGEGNG